MKQVSKRDRPEGSSQFPPTRWTLVRQFQDQAPKDDHSRHVALAELCRIYWSPLYAFARRSGFSPEDAEDLIQDFFAALLRRDALRQVEQSKGRLRSFLLGALKNHLRETYRRNSRQKRGGGAGVLSIDVALGERRLLDLADEAINPDQAYDRAWVSALLDEVLREFESECRRTGHRGLFEWVAPHLIEAADDQVPYPRMAEAFGVSESAARVTVHRMRKRYRTLLRQRIADTLDEHTSLGEELNYLIGLFGQGSTHR